MTSIIFDVPPGIGDISWVYSKIVDLLPTTRIAFKICGDEPRRSHEFVSLLPGVLNLSYGGFYRYMVKRLLPYNADLRKLKAGHYSLSLNPHLEAGQRIEDAYPLQRAHYHYPLNTTPRQQQAADKIAQVGTATTKIGFYCSSYKHRKDLGWWMPDQWITFLNRVNAAVPNAEFISLGAAYDDKTTDVVNQLSKQGKLKVRSIVGQTDVGTTLEVLKRLDYFTAFPSGLGVLCDVIKTPCLMSYWSNLLEQFKDFPKSYADPESLTSHRHLIVPYLEPDEIFEIFLDKGLPWINKRLIARNAK